MALLNWKHSKADVNETLKKLMAVVSCREKYWTDELSSITGETPYLCRMYKRLSNI